MYKRYYLSCATLRFASVFLISFLITSLTIKGQTLTAVPSRLHANVGGYYESLPADYATATTKKYPLLLYIHNVDGIGNGSVGQLPNILNDTVSVIPNRINNGAFPAEFTLNGQKFSFIVIAPQFQSMNSVRDDSTQINKIIDSCIAKYRVDTSRIYLTGSLTGARVSWIYATSIATHANRLAAIMFTSPAILGPYADKGAIAGNANLPVWFTTNYGNSGTSSRGTLSSVVDNHINAATSPNPSAKLSVFDTLMLYGNDSYTKAYDPAFKENGLNVYEWMLQYTNNKLTANAGPDQGYTKTTGGKTITLDGSKSMARGGDITGYSWSLISGKAGTTITSPVSSITTVTGLDTGAYVFKLTVTHTDASTAADTVKVSTQGFQLVSKKINYTPTNQKGINGFLLSLPPIYDANTSRNFPLLIFNHGVSDGGDGSQSALTQLYNNGLPGPFKDGNFPDQILLEDGTSQSFIIVAPQRGTASNNVTQNEIMFGLQRLIDTCAKYYRIDSSRVYMTGLSQGGGITGSFAGLYPQKLAAINTTAAFSNNLLYRRYDSVAASNLPVLITHNKVDATNPISMSGHFFNRINNYNPDVNPKPIIDTFQASGHNSWTVNYDKGSILDSAKGLNLYKWLLQYTNEKLIAKAGPDQAITAPSTSVTLNGTNSRARGNIDSANTPIYNRVGTYAWSQLPGTSATITSPNSGVTTVTGLTPGTYVFVLSVSHSIETTLVKRDTIVVTVSAASPRQAVSEEKLEPVDVSKELLDVKLNPNPVRSNLTVFVSGKATGNASLALYNLRGQKVSQQQFNKPSGQTVARNVPVSNLPTGAYAIQVIIAGKTKTIQFIKE